MKKLNSILFMLTLGVNSLLIFLWIFDQQVNLPSWLQVAGRMHPMVLHLPIAFLLLNLLLVFLPAQQKKSVLAEEFSATFLLLTACSSAITALFGLFLSREHSYDPQTLQLHKWTGILVSVSCFIWYWFRAWFADNRKKELSLGITLTLVLLVTGHEGASITHGQDYVFEPLHQYSMQQIALADARIFEDVLKPIIDEKCISCHNEKKAKGELIMESIAQLKKGGKTGKLWEPGKVEAGLLMKRLHLPMEDKKHMPPPGKPQLEDEELQLLTTWLKSGAPLDGKLVDLPANDSFKLAASSLFAGVKEERYDFADASEKTIASLNNSNRIVSKTDETSPALVAKFYNSAFYTSQALEELSAIAEQLVELDLTRMPLKEEDLKTIAGFKNLRKLNLNFTGIKGNELSSLANHKALKTISLAGTSINLEQLKPLQEMKSLQHLVIWNTAISEEQLEKLRSLKTGIHYETGFRSDTMILQLSAPVFQNEETVIREAQPVKLKHYINGTEIRYTLDGTDPDSLKSPLFDGKLMVQKNLEVRAKAFKKGWISSPISTQFFYKSTYKPDTIVFLKPSDPKYSSTGPKVLFDLQKGDFNFASGIWLGFKENNMEAVLQFNKPPAISNITLSCLKLVGSYIMPAESAEILGSNDQKSWKSLAVKKPQQPEKIEPGLLMAIDLTFPVVSYKFYKVILRPVSKLPKWHPGKGDKGWAFVDEIFIN